MKKREKGRPEFEPTDRQRGMVAGMALWNVPIEQMRQKIIGPNGKPINFRTFKKVFATELQESFTSVETNLATAMYKRGMKGSDKAAMYILSCKFGWKPEENAPETYNVLPQLTEEQTKEFFRLLPEILKMI